MTQLRGNSRIIDIEDCKVAMRKGDAIAVINGTTEVVQRADGTRYEREKYIWLPCSQVEENSDGTISLPEWLAASKGLI